MEDKLIDILQNFKNDKNYHELNAVDDILRLFDVVGQSEQLVCDKCDFVELQGEIYQCTKCYKIEDRLAN